MQTFSYKMNRDLSNLWEKLTRTSGKRDEDGSALDQKRWLYFLLWLFLLFVGICMGSWGVVLRMSVVLTAFNFIMSSPLKETLELEKKWQHPILLCVVLTVLTVLIPTNGLVSYLFPCVRLLGVGWLCCEGAIIIDVAHHVHHRIIKQANLVHRTRGFSVAARWYALHIALSVSFIVLAAIIYATVNEGGSWVSNGVDFATISTMTLLGLCSVWVNVNKGALVPAIVLIYAALQCWAIRAALVRNADSAGFLITFHFILMCGTVIFGVVQERSPTLHSWATKCAAFAPMCCVRMGGYGALTMTEGAMSDSTYDAVEEGNAGLGLAEQTTLMTGEFSASAVASDLVSQSGGEVTPLFHILLALSASSAVLVGDSLGEAVSMPLAWAAIQSIALLCLCVTFAQSIWHTYKHQRQLFASRAV
jgi:hypothetical protein